MFEGAAVRVRVERTGPLAVLILDAGADNRLTSALRAEVIAALDREMADAAVQSVVMLGEGAVFATEGEEASPTLGALCLAVEEAAKPVVVALQGSVLDGALELALAAQGRVAEAGATFGFPAVTLGLVPGAGGTQRLPRLVGVGPALDLLTSGRRIGAGEALVIGLVDRVAEGQDDLLTAALAMASERGMRRDRSPTDLASAIAAVAEARAAAVASPLQGARRIVDCVEATLLLPFAQGLDFEAAARADVVDLPEVAALQALARAEARAAARPPFAEVAVAGSISLAAEFLGSGMAVTLVRPDRTSLIAALETIAAVQGLAVESGRLTEAQREADWARLTPALDVPDGMPFVQVEDEGVLVVVGSERSQATLHTGLAEVQTETAAALLARSGRFAIVTRGPLLDPLRTALKIAATHEALRAGRAEVQAGLDRLGPAVEGLPEGGAAPPGPVQARLLAALANQGLRLIGEGAADHPSDIDAALVHGAGWLRHVPGPMLWAARRGLLVLRADLNRWKDEMPLLWEPAPLIDVMLRRGTRLDALEG